MILQNPPAASENEALTVEIGDFSSSHSLSCSSAQREHRREGGASIEMATLGGIKDVSGSENSTEIEELARFAVEEHNKKENALLEFAGVVNVKQQVVAGTVYYLTVEVVNGGEKELYEAKVWVKTWMNFKELQEFKRVDGSTS